MEAISHIKAYLNQYYNIIVVLYWYALRFGGSQIPGHAYYGRNEGRLRSTLPHLGLIIQEQN